MALQRLSQLQGLLPRPQGALRDFKLAVERTKLEISGGHVSNQRGDYGPLTPFGGKQLGASRLGLSAVFSPEVQIPDHRQVQVASIDLVSGKEVRNFGVLLAENIGPDVCGGELISAGNANLRLCLEHAGGGNAHVIILRNGSVEQLREYLMLINLSPLR